MKTLHSKLLLVLCAALLTFGGTSSNLLLAQASKASASGAKVDLNSGSEKELESLPGVGPATAKKIIAGRPYSSASDLSKAGVAARVITQITPLVTAGGAAAQAPAASAKAAAPAPQPAPSAPSKPAPAAPAKAASAPASQGTPGPGTVWVNSETGVYHYSNSRYYGKTKTGKYMSEADANKAGYHPAKNEKKPQ